MYSVAMTIPMPFWMIQDAYMQLLGCCLESSIDCTGVQFVRGFRAGTVFLHFESYMV